MTSNTYKSPLDRRVMATEKGLLREVHGNLLRDSSIGE